MMNAGCLIENGSKIVLGDRVYIGPRSMLLTESHILGQSTQRAGALTSQEIRIEDGSWLGAQVCVLPGVVIGSGCVIAAGSVVTRSCAPNGLYAGVPARRIRDLPREVDSND